MIEGNCKNFTGLLGPGCVEYKTCEAGHNYDSFAPRLPLRAELPCFERNGVPCPDCVFPTPEELEQDEREWEEIFKVHMAVRSAITALKPKRGTSGHVECPQCKGKLHYSVAAQAGHSAISTTSNFYAHVTAGAQQRAASLMPSIMPSASSKK